MRTHSYQETPETTSSQSAAQERALNAHVNGELRLTVETLAEDDAAQVEEEEHDDDLLLVVLHEMRARLDGHLCAGVVLRKRRQLHHLRPRQAEDPVPQRWHLRLGTLQVCTCNTNTFGLWMTVNEF